MKRKNNEKKQPEKKDLESSSQGRPARGLEILEEAGYRMVKGPVYRGPEDKN